MPSKIISDIYDKAPYENYQDLMKDLEDTIPIDKTEKLKYDYVYTSPLAALRRSVSDGTATSKISQLEIHGIVLKIEDTTADKLKKIWIDVPIAKSVRPVTHPDDFIETNKDFDIKKYEHIAFYAETINQQNSDPPVRGGIAKIHIDPNFPDSNASNKYLGMVERTTVFNLSDNAKTLDNKQTQVNTGDAKANESASLPGGYIKLTADDVKDSKTMYEKITFGLKNDSNKRALEVKREIIKKLLTINDLQFRADITNLIDISWKNNLPIGIDNIIRDDWEQALMYVGGRYCKSGKNYTVKEYPVIALPFVSSHAVVLATDIEGLDHAKLQHVLKKDYNFEQIENINKVYHIGLTWIGATDPMHWGYDSQEKYYRKRQQVWNEQGITTANLSDKTVEIIKKAIKYHYNKGAVLLQEPTNIKGQQLSQLQNNSWWDVFYRGLTTTASYASR